MLPEIAQISLILALIISIFQGIYCFQGQGARFAKQGTYMTFMLVALAYGILTYSFIIHDFSIDYVSLNSNLIQPLIYRISGVWGAHEGSLLLWILIQSTWTLLVAIYSRSIPSEFTTRVLSILAWINVGFLSFMLFTSNPFARKIPVPIDGRELNPLLQDPGLAIHPPMLYLGYVGFSVAFAFAIAALLSGKLDSQWARWARPWTGAAWLFLTIGITLGSWWAYYELGWGGWWFWDPVENASFMPWLVGTALMHSLAVTEKRGAFIAWTVLLAITTFSLSLLGTFIVRSGLLTSVHAFASDPERGLFILVFLLIVIGGSLLLYSLRAYKIRSTVGFALFSKESNLLLNNVFLIVSAFMVFLGTLFPLVIEAMGKGKISVGAPYFDFMFAVLMLPLTLLVGFGSMARWKHDQISRFKSPAIVLAIISIIGAIIITFLMSQQTETAFSIGATSGVFLSLWIIGWAIYGWKERAKNQSSLLKKLKQPASFIGMTVAHIGVALFVLGVTHVNTYSIEKDLSMSFGDTFKLRDFEVQFAGVEDKAIENYFANEGKFIITRNGKKVTELKPQKRLYSNSTEPMTEAAINTSLGRDLYVSLGQEALNAPETWSVRLYYKSFVVWIWIGGFVMALGASIALFDRRYRKAKVLTENEKTSDKVIKNIGTAEALSLANEST